MFRRRPMFPPAGGRRVPPRLLRRLQRANRLLASGRPAEAAPLFAQLAQAAETAGRMPRAAQLHARAARAWFEAGNPQAGMEHLRRALRLAERLPHGEAALRIARRAAPRLRELGYTQQAAEVEAFLRRAPGPPAPRSAPAETVRAITCPQCGASLQADERLRVDARTVECAYCGSLLSIG